MTNPIAVRGTTWNTVLLLCGKCLRKLDGGYGPDGKDSLRTALRGELKAAGLRGQVRLIETRCLGICPKKAVMALNASRPDRLLTVAKRAPAAEVLAQLLPCTTGADT